MKVKDIFEKCGYKKPKSQQERRRNTSKDDEGVKARAKRKPKNLPNVYDDKPTTQPGRSWKGYRKTQYKS